MNKKEIKEQRNKFLEIEKGLIKDFEEVFNQPCFYGVQYMILDLILGIFLTVVIIISLRYFNDFFAYGFGFIFFFWLQGENIWVLKGNKYNFYNWKTGAIKRHKKIEEMKNIVENIRR